MPVRDALHLARTGQMPEGQSALSLLLCESPAARTRLPRRGFAIMMTRWIEKSGDHRHYLVAQAFQPASPEKRSYLGTQAGKPALPIGFSLHP